MKKAVRTLEELSQDENIIGLYDAEEVERKIWNTKLLYAEKVGKEEGIKQGKIEGKKDNQIETAKRLIKMGLSEEQIIEATGLSITELNDL